MHILIAFILMFLFATDCSAKSCSDNILVLYYSQTGVTKIVAEEIQKRLGADIEAIEVTHPYDGTFDETVARCLKEMEINALPHIRPFKSDLKKYNVIFLGYPIWFGTYARPVITLVNLFNLAGKKIIPFCTFGSGGLIESTDHLRKALPMAHIQNGYGIREARISKVSEEVDRFLKLNGYIEGEVEVFPEYSKQQEVSAKDIEIFNAACSSYKFPLGTPVSVGSRKTALGVDYLFCVNGKNPKGEDVKSIVYITVENDKAPVFTLVVR